jgi:hypothetical protein
MFNQALFCHESTKFCHARTLFAGDKQVLWYPNIVRPHRADRTRFCVEQTVFGCVKHSPNKKFGSAALCSDVTEILDHKPLRAAQKPVTSAKFSVEFVQI